MLDTHADSDTSLASLEQRLRSAELSIAEANAIKSQIETRVSETLALIREINKGDSRNFRFILGIWVLMGIVIAAAGALNVKSYFDISGDRSNLQSRFESLQASTTIATTQAIEKMRTEIKDTLSGQEIATADIAPVLNIEQGTVYADPHIELGQYGSGNKYSLVLDFNFYITATGPDKSMGKLVAVYSNLSGFLGRYLSTYNGSMDQINESQLNLGDTFSGNLYVSTAGPSLISRKVATPAKDCAEAQKKLDALYAEQSKRNDLGVLKMRPLFEKIGTPMADRSFRVKIGETHMVFDCAELVRREYSPAQPGKIAAPQ